MKGNGVNELTAYIEPILLLTGGLVWAHFGISTALWLRDLPREIAWQLWGKARVIRERRRQAERQLVHALVSAGRPARAPLAADGSAVRFAPRRRYQGLRTYGASDAVALERKRSSATTSGRASAHEPINQRRVRANGWTVAHEAEAWEEDPDAWR